MFLRVNLRFLSKMSRHQVETNVVLLCWRNSKTSHTAWAFSRVSKWDTTKNIYVRDKYCLKIEIPFWGNGVVVVSKCPACKPSLQTQLQADHLYGSVDTLCRPSERRGVLPSCCVLLGRKRSALRPPGWSWSGMSVNGW